MGKIAVLGLGKSLELYRSEDYEMSIGVNDIWSYYHVPAVVCVDHPSAFTPQRLSVINSCRPIAFYSQMVIWDTRSDFVKIEILPNYPDNFISLDKPQHYKSFCSPFIACQIAFKNYYATEIHLFGVDLVDHPHLNVELCQKIKLHFVNLKKALTEKGCDLIVHGEGILKSI